MNGITDKMTGLVPYNRSETQSRLLRDQNKCITNNFIESKYQQNSVCDETTNYPSYNKGRQESGLKVSSNVGISMWTLMMYFVSSRKYQVKRQSSQLTLSTQTSMIYRCVPREHIPLHYGPAINMHSALLTTWIPVSWSLCHIRTLPSA